MGHLLSRCLNGEINWLEENRSNLVTSSLSLVISFLALLNSLFMASFIARNTVKIKNEDESKIFLQAHLSNKRPGAY